MTQRTGSKPRVLAIYPYRKGFGFAVLELGRLVNWGLVGVKATDDGEFLVRVRTLADRYQAGLVAIEGETSHRRSVAARRRVLQVISYCENRLPATRVSGVRDVFGLAAAVTNHDIATTIARYFPELTSLLPPRRPFYEPEDDRMNVFKAVAIAVAALCGSAQP